MSATNILWLAAGVLTTGVVLFALSRSVSLEQLSVLGQRVTLKQPVQWQGKRWLVFPSSAALIIGAVLMGWGVWLKLKPPEDGPREATLVLRVRSFCDAAKQYVKAVDELLTESHQIAKDANSIRLTQTFTPLLEAAGTPEEEEQVTELFKSSLEQSDRLLRESRSGIEAAQSQLALLFAYFSKLEASSMPSAGPQSVAELEESLARLNGEWRGSLAFTKSLVARQRSESLLVGMTWDLRALLEGEVPSKALEDELQARASTVAEVLVSHQELLKTVASQMEHDIEMTRMLNYKEKVSDQLLAKIIADPETWREERLDLLTSDSSPLVRLHELIGVNTKVQIAWQGLVG